jgi:hypothetical protein
MNTKQIIIPAILVMSMMLLTIGPATAGVPMSIDGNIYWSNGTLCSSFQTGGGTIDITNDNTSVTWNRTTSNNILVVGGYYSLDLDYTDDIANTHKILYSVACGGETNTTANFIYTGSSSDVTFDIHLDAPTAPADLIVESITPAPNATYAKGYIFAKECNDVGIVIKNNGSTAAPQSSVCVEITGAADSPWTLTVPLLNPTDTATVYLTDCTSRDAGTSVDINVTADCGDDVTEGASGEANNFTTQTKTVMKQGFKGKTYTGPTHPDGHPTNMTTWKCYDLNGDMVYSSGNSLYQSGSAGWTHYIVNWAVGDQPNVPSGATVKEARLNIPYCYAAKLAMPNGTNPGNYTMEFNGNPVPLDEHYWDTKFYDGKDYPYYGALVYNVTAEYVQSPYVNTANLTSLWAANHGGHGGASIRGAVLTVIYEDATEPRRVIFANEGFDMLGASWKQDTTTVEATAWGIINPMSSCPFNSDDVAKTRLVTFVPGANPDEGDLLFNQYYDANVWNYLGSTQIGYDDRDLDIAHLNNDSINEIGFRCSSEGYMETDKMFLVVTLGAAKIGIDQPKFVDPQSQFTINITVDPGAANKVSAVQYDLYYNTSVVWAEWANPGTFLNRSGPTDVTVLSIDNTWNVTSHTGKISYAETTLGNNDSDLPYVETSGVLTTIHFSAIGERGTYSVMDIKDVLVSDPDKKRVAYLITDCGVTIYDNIPPVANGSSKYWVSNVASKFQCFAALCCCNSHGGDPLGGEHKGNEIVYVRWDFGDGQYGTSEGLEDCQKHHEYTTWNWVGGAGGYYEPFIAYLTVRDDGEPQLSNTTEVPVMVYIAGDTNSDGVVDILDAACVGKHYGQEADNNPPLNCTPYWTDEQADEADLNNDNRVTTIDLMIVGTNWNHLAYAPYIQD